MWWLFRVCTAVTRYKCPTHDLCGLIRRVDLRASVAFVVICKCVYHSQSYTWFQLIYQISNYVCISIKYSHVSELHDCCWSIWRSIICAYVWNVWMLVNYNSVFKFMAHNQSKTIFFFFIENQFVLINHEFLTKTNGHTN